MINTNYDKFNTELMNRHRNLFVKHSSKINKIRKIVLGNCIK